MKLQFTNEYYPRFDQISRILQILIPRFDKNKISNQAIGDTLGIPKRQVKSYISMMVGFGLIYPKQKKVTPFGKIVSQFDQYFERIETLWLIHFQVSTQPQYVVWHRMINQVLPSMGEISLSVLQVRDVYFSDLDIYFSNYTYASKLKGEIRAVCRAYTESSLSRLGILGQDGKYQYVKSEHVEVPPLVFLFCLLHYRDNHSPGSSAMNIQDICSAENSPGRVLNLADDQVRAILNQLHDLGLIRLEQLASLDQVRLSDSITQEKALDFIYRVENVN